MEPARFVGRRGIAVLALVAVALVAGGPTAAQERVQGDLYTNSHYGIQIGKPSAWHFITAGMIVELAKKTAGAAQLRGEDDPVKLAGFAVIVSKVPSLGREIAPQVVLLVHELKERPTDLLQTCEKLRAGVNDPETVEPTREVQIDGRPAARLDFRAVVDGALVRATALCTVRDRQAYVVAAQALAADFEVEAHAFETILQSFRLK
jgi:hypothetical protein